MHATETGEGEQGLPFSLLRNDEFQRGRWNDKLLEFKALYLSRNSESVERAAHERCPVQLDDSREYGLSWEVAREPAQL